MTCALVLAAPLATTPPLRCLCAQTVTAEIYEGTPLSQYDAVYRAKVIVELAQALDEARYPHGDFEYNVRESVRMLRLVASPPKRQWGGVAAARRVALALIEVCTHEAPRREAHRTLR